MLNCIDCPPFQPLFNTSLKYYPSIQHEQQCKPLPICNDITDLTPKMRKSRDVECYLCCHHHQRCPEMIRCALWIRIIERYPLLWNFWLWSRHLCDPPICDAPVSQYDSSGRSACPPLVDITFLMQYLTQGSATALAGVLRGNGPPDTHEVCLPIHLCSVWVEAVWDEHYCVLSKLFLICWLTTWLYQILLENRYKSDIFNDCVMGVDRADNQVTDLSWEKFQLQRVQCLCIMPLWLGTFVG